MHHLISYHQATQTAGEKHSLSGLLETHCVNNLFNMHEQWFKVSLLEMWWLLEKPVNKKKKERKNKDGFEKKLVERSQNGFEKSSVKKKSTSTSQMLREKR